MFRRNTTSSTVKRASRRAAGRLTHQAIVGAAIQRSSIGAAMARAAGLIAPKESAAAIAVTGALHIVMYEASNPGRLVLSASLAVRHSSRRRFVRMRTVERTIASIL